jgi:hypothetical protein
MRRERKDNEYKSKSGFPRETIVEERIWNKRPDGLPMKIPTSVKVGEFVILEFKRKSNMTDEYVTRKKHVTIVQHVSIKSTNF